MSKITIITTASSVRPLTSDTIGTCIGVRCQFQRRQYDILYVIIYIILIHNHIVVPLFIYTNTKVISPSSSHFNKFNVISGNSQVLNRKNYSITLPHDFCQTLPRRLRTFNLTLQTGYRLLQVNSVFKGFSWTICSNIIPLAGKTHSFS